MTLYDELLLHFSAQTSRARPFHWWNGSEKAAGEVSEIEFGVKRWIKVEKGEILLKWFEN